MSNLTDAHTKSDHTNAFDHNRTSRPRHRRHIRHTDRSIANVLVRAAIRTGKLERLKATFQEGRFYG